MGFEYRATTTDMGLDGVEIVMAVEEAFDIRIEDAEAEAILMPRQLIDLVVSKIATTTTDVCLTHRSFNLLRRFFVERCAFQRNEVRPDMSLRTAFPAPLRYARLEQLSAELALPSLPQLVRPEGLKGVLIFMTIAAGLIAAIFWPFWITVALAVAVTGYFAAATTRHCRTEFPKDLPTVAELATWIMRHKPDLAASGRRSFLRFHIQRVCIQGYVPATAIRPSHYSPTL